ncbi:MAG: ribonuclease PH [Syntrophales bacterium]
MRNGGRKWDEIRNVRFTKDFLGYAKGSVLVEMGNTRVICSASVEDGVPPFLKNTGQGWLTAEYSMLPAATQIRSQRETTRGRIGGRTHEIQRLIGRSLRAVTDLHSFGERTVYIDCDVIQADGGTRTASITGGFIALVEAFRRLKEEGVATHIPVRDYVSAVSVGLVGERILLDLDYEEDSRADVDMNFVMTSGGLFIEVQGTAEVTPFSRQLLGEMMNLAEKGICRLIDMQMGILGGLI